MSSTDTNQASEDELRQSLATLFYDDSYEYMLSEPDLFDVGSIDAAVELIRTEKLKLLAEVRERVIGENDRGTITHPDSPSYGEPYESTAADKDEQRAELDKLEAEL